jgi:hypothetical protein
MLWGLPQLSVWRAGGGGGGVVQRKAADDREGVENVASSQQRLAELEAAVLQLRTSLQHSSHGGGAWSCSPCVRMAMLMRLTAAPTQGTRGWI